MCRIAQGKLLLCFLLVRIRICLEHGVFCVTKNVKSKMNIICVKPVVIFICYKKFLLKISIWNFICDKYIILRINTKLELYMLLNIPQEKNVSCETLFLCCSNKLKKWISFIK